MKRNRKITKKRSVVATNTVYFGAVLLMLFVMVIMNLLASSSCQQLMKAIGEKERSLAKLEEERVRESARWEEMMTPEKLESALLKHGLAMKYPKADQVVRMRANGTPVPGQRSVAKARQRNGLAAASYESAALSPRKRRTVPRQVR